MAQARSEEQAELTRTQSVVVTMLRQLAEAQGEKAWAAERLYQALALQLDALILVGAAFLAEDFATIAQDPQLEFHRWAGGDGDRFYRRAVQAQNRSACHAFEAWKGQGQSAHARPGRAAGGREKKGETDGL